jgi:tetrahydromethanopterin S-methyltransferase subunit B
MKNIYIYPKYAHDDNPYIKNLENSLSKHYKIINKYNTRNGVLDLFTYLFRTDAFFLIGLKIWR